MVVLFLQTAQEYQYFTSSASSFSNISDFISVQKSIFDLEMKQVSLRKRNLVVDVQSFGQKRKADFEKRKNLLSKRRSCDAAVRKRLILAEKQNNLRNPSE